MATKKNWLPRRFGIRAKLMVASGVILTVLLVALVSFLWNAQTEQYEAQVQQQITAANAALVNGSAQRAAAAEGFASSVADNPDLSAAFATAITELKPLYDAHWEKQKAAKKPTTFKETSPEALKTLEANPSLLKLRQALGPVNAKQKGPYDVEQFQFHLPPARSFFRVHTSKLEGDKWSLGPNGDDLASFRFTVLSANGAWKPGESPHPVRGLELGRGGFGIRGVVPVYSNGQHVGSVEYGLGFDGVVTTTAKSTKANITIFVSEDMAKAIEWDVVTSKQKSKEKVVKRKGQFLLSATDSKFADALTDADIVEAKITDAKKLAATDALNFSGTSTNDTWWRNGAFPLIDFSGRHVGTVVVSVDETAARAAMNRARWTALALSLVGGLVLLLGLDLLIRRFVLVPLSNVEQTMRRVGERDFKARVLVGANDEVGSVGTGINKTLDEILVLIESDEERRTLQLSIQEMLEAVAKAAEGDLTTKLAVGAGNLGNVADAMNLMFENMAGAIGKIRDGAVRVNGAAVQIQSGSENLAAGSRQQVNDLASATAAVQQMSMRINEVAQSAQQTAIAADTSRERAMAGREQVRLVIDGMEGMRSSVVRTLHQIKGLGDRSLEISKIVDTITQIAGQTDLLALNAAIEAARAGEQGRGFAVVAEEVRRLAERSSEAAKEISDLVGSIQQQTTESVRAMDETAAGVERQVKVAYSAGATLEAIAELSQRAADLITNINTIAQQQAKGAGEVVATVDAAAGISTRAAANIEETRQTTQSLVRLADDLTGAVQQFNVN